MINSSSEWHHRAVCPKCGWHDYLPFADLRHIGRECCPDCAELVSYSWRVVVMRCVPVEPVKWWNPLTWLPPHAWQTKGETK